MSKRGAERYLTNQPGRDEDNDDEPEPTGEFKRASEEKLKERVIAAPKRLVGAFAAFSFGAAAQPATAPPKPPAPTPAFANFSFGAPPPAAPSFYCRETKPSNALLLSPCLFNHFNHFNYFNYSSINCKSYSETKALASQLRGLNEDFLAHIQTLLKKDPFADLSAATSRYQSHYKSVIDKNAGAVTRATSPVKTTASAVGWTCGTCLVPNAGDKTSSKPVAASTAAFSFAPSSSATTTSATTGFQFSPASKEAPSSTAPTFGFSTTPKTAALAKPSGSNWECNTCLVSNPSDKLKCVACEADKPGSAPAKSTTATTGGFSFGGSTTTAASTTSTTGGFSFSGATTSTSAPTPAGGFTFGGAQPTPAPAASKPAASGPTWNCETCLSPNPSDKVKCLACEADKPGAAPAPKASGGFTFGTASATPAPPSAGGFSFGSSQLVATAKPAASAGPSWTCDTCLVTNLLTKVKCLASAPAAKPSATSFSFGSTSSSTPATTGGFSFGTPASNSSATVALPTTGGFSFKAAEKPEEKSSAAAPPATTGGFSFGGATSSSSFSFGTKPAAAAPAPASTFSGFGSLAPTTTPSFGGFGSLAPATTTPTFGGFGNLTSAAPAATTEETAGGDDDDEPEPDEQIDQSTLMRGAGEESEETLHEVLSKTSKLNATDKKWEDVGKGILKVNWDASASKGRLILRADGSGRVLLNAAVYKGMKITIEGGKSVSYLVPSATGGFVKHLTRLKGVIEDVVSKLG
ncbi:hypothetical protein BCR33DRAFT_715545 [Rhizoclosmatium globosum]|uniref:Nuclear pore complex protein Nup153 n=1 Tax=Rhizoclosmatium globosum TaxID=329046 RepID=A0A1Y2CHJ0_9FUNG|nr:hypothetical protein BCR33DRAFT_715545 [Rhizoclosmatium globosum]|eukprot:ORY46472.1 hypothetical protein BCR33DRAFT_715545 [Rhizoclosmatium globosum]